MKRNLFEYEKIIIGFLPYSSYKVITLLSFPFLNEKLWTLQVLVLKRFGRKLVLLAAIKIFLNLAFMKRYANKAQ